MSNHDLPISDGRAPMPDSAAAIGGGELLRKARESAGLHIGALAVALKVPVKKLEALEANRFDLLPDTVFVRALTSSVCRTLKIDPAPILEKMPFTTALHLKIDESGINIPFRSSASGPGFFHWHQFSKPFVWVIFGLFVGILILVFFPLFERAEFVGAQQPVGATVDFPPALSPAVSAVAGETAITGQLPAPVSSSLRTSIAMNQVPVVSTSVTPDAVVNGSGASTGPVVFKAHGVSWVEVVDASGVVQVRRNIAAGEVVGVTGAMPLSVVVGRADTTEVEVRGQPFDLERVAKDNVARFEVK
jgi:cytoskeleton protein RodZ